jgi:nucleoside-diphosphate-sugar epimerase
LKRRRAHLLHAPSSLLLVGYGDIAARIAEQALSETPGGPVYSLSRHCPAAPAHAWPLDLDRMDAQLNGDARAACSRSVLIYTAPPAAHGTDDTRVTRLIALLGASRPRGLVYLSTSGVYGDCGGAWVDESRLPAPGNDRARRRLSAERQWTAYAQAHQIPLTILRVPGIYGPGRLPLQRLRDGLPVVCPNEAPWSNRVHADDLAWACLLAARTPPASGIAIYPVVDDEPSSTTDFLYRIADYAGLPRPPCRPLAELREQSGAMQREFLDESRRLSNARIKAQLGWTPRYPTLDQGLPGCFD